MLDMRTADHGITTITEMVVKHFYQPKQVVAEEEDRQEELLRFSVGQRLRGAYACYRKGMQIECLRHIMLALDGIAYAMGWDKVSTYLNAQNEALYVMGKGERGEA